MATDEDGETVHFAFEALSKEDMEMRRKSGGEMGQKGGVEPNFLECDNVGSGGEREEKVKNGVKTWSPESWMDIFSV